jgi:hypothetical protein
VSPSLSPTREFKDASDAFSTNRQWKIPSSDRGASGAPAVPAAAPYRQGQSDASARPGNEREANRLAVAWIADFQAAITNAASVTENPHGYDWITRDRAYHRGQNRFPPEARLYPPHPALAIRETQAKPIPFDRIILLWTKQTNAPKKGKQDMETKLDGSPNGSVTMTWRALASRTAGITATR